MTLTEFNSLSKKEAYDNLFRCCGSTQWANRMMENFPFDSIESLKIISDKIWFQCDKKDWIEAFSHHPKIGDKPSKQHSSTADWAMNEQAGVVLAEHEIKSQLITANKQYEEQFGYIYIVCATGKSAEELLEILKSRLKNDPDKEFQIASAEQNKITHLRINKLLS